MCDRNKNQSKKLTATFRNYFLLMLIVHLMWFLLRYYNDKYRMWIIRNAPAHQMCEQESTLSRFQCKSMGLFPTCFFYLIF